MPFATFAIIFLIGDEAVTAVTACFFRPGTNRLAIRLLARTILCIGSFVLIFLPAFSGGQGYESRGAISVAFASYLIGMSLFDGGRLLRTNREINRRGFEVAVEQNR